MFETYSPPKKRTGLITTVYLLLNEISIHNAINLFINLLRRVKQSSPYSLRQLEETLSNSQRIYKEMFTSSYHFATLVKFYLNWIKLNIFYQNRQMYPSSACLSLDGKCWRHFLRHKKKPRRINAMFAQTRF